MSGSVHGELVEVLGAPIRVVRGGSGPPLLFLHGMGGAGLWLDFHDRLAAELEVIAPEQPGFGGSPTDERIETMEDLVYLYLELIERCDIRDAVLVGCSLGGWLAAELAVHHSESFRGLVLLSAVGLELPEHPFADVFALTPEETLDIVFEDKALARSLAPAEVTPEMILAASRERSAAARIASSPLLANPKLAGRLHRVRCPTLVVWGAQDRLSNVAHGERYAELIPSARLVVLDGVGHGTYIEASEATARPILEFINEL
jgi:pimeloyl-ACP methyl ester carboxylesterase